MPLEGECRIGDSGGGPFQISGGIHDNCVFSAHLGNDPFDPDLSFRYLGSFLIDAKPDFFRAGKVYKPGQRMLYDIIPDHRAGTRNKIDNSRRESGLFAKFYEFVSDNRSVGRWFTDDGVPGDNRRNYHASQ